MVAASRARMSEIEPHAPSKLIAASRQVRVAQSAPGAQSKDPLFLTAAGKD